MNRRRFILETTRMALGAAAVPSLLTLPNIASSSTRDAVSSDARPRQQDRDWSQTRSELDESLTPYEHVTTYNNFYEFGTGKVGGVPRGDKRRFGNPWLFPADSDAVCA